MKKFRGMLICSDLDGTLLDKDRRISEKNARAIEYFKSEGGLFTIVTGRTHITVKGIYEMAKPNCYIGCINGGGIYDYENQRYVLTHPVDKRAFELAEYACAQIPGMGYQANTFEEIYFCKENSAQQWFREVTGVKNISMPPYEIKEELAKIVFADKNEDNIQKLQMILEEHPLKDMFHFVRSEKYLYEILPKGVNKGTLICDLAKIMNIDISRIIAVGDYNNDVEMIKMAGVGFAVENACTEAKEAADYITVNHVDGAIHDIVYGIESGKYTI